MIDQSRMYELSQDDSGQLYLEVVAGGFAMYCVVVPLTSEEQVNFQQQGKSFLDDLAWRIGKSPEDYRERSSR